MAAKTKTTVKNDIYFVIQLYDGYWMTDDASTDNPDYAFHFKNQKAAEAHIKWWRDMIVFNHIILQSIKKRWDTAKVVEMRVKTILKVKEVKGN